VSAPVRTIGLAHLVHASNGPQPLERFLAAHRAHDAGVDHELVLLLKGFTDARAAREHVALAGHATRTLLVPDDGYDLGAYWTAVARLEHETLVFVNSFAEPLADGWLARLAGALDEPSVGVAGATGSWASQRDYLRWQLCLPSGYAGSFTSRREARAQLLRIHDANDRGWLAHKAGAALDGLVRLRGATGFPAAHLRTNAFAARRELLARIVLPPIRTKADAHRFESGADSFTAHVRGRGLRAVVVGRDGVVHDEGGWAASATFNQGRQEHLLVADNRTRLYDRADMRGRQHLAWLAWGPLGRAG
jgi:hypothetical protein